MEALGDAEMVGCSCSHRITLLGESPAQQSAGSRHANGFRWLFPGRSENKALCIKSPCPVSVYELVICVHRAREARCERLARRFYFL